MKPVSIILLVFISSLIVTQSRDLELHSQLVECQRNSTNHSESLKEDLVNCKQNYTVQSEDASIRLLKQSQLIETCEQNYTVQSNLLEDASKKLLKQSQLIETCEQNYTAQASLLEDASNKLLIYKKQSQLIESVDNQIEQMETCSMKLKEYCELKSKRKYKLTESERSKMNRFLKYLGCNNVISEHHYHRTFVSFNDKLKSLLRTKENLIGLLISGDFKALEKEQERLKDLPFTKCQFICDLEEQEVDTNSDFYKKITDTAWNIYERVFCS